MGSCRRRRARQQQRRRHCLGTSAGNVGCPYRRRGSARVVAPFGPLRFGHDVRRGRAGGGAGIRARLTATLTVGGGTQFCTVEQNGMSKLSFEVRSGVAVLTLDNPPVNSL